MMVTQKIRGILVTGSIIRFIGKRKSADLNHLRRPLKLRFDPPASPGNWRMTGEFNQPAPSYGIAPACEWVDDIGRRIWLPAKFADLVKDGA